MSDSTSIATAPGDLPASEVARRYQTIHDQFRHENTIDPGVPVANEAVVVTALSGAGAAIQSGMLRFTTDGSRPGSGGPGTTTTEIPLRRTGTDWVVFGGYVARWEATIPGQPPGTVVRYSIAGINAEGREIHAQDGHGFWYRYAPAESVTTFAYRVPSRPLVPEWFHDAVIYQIFVDRFRRPGGMLNSNDLQAKHGGQLAGIEEALPYLEELGVNCIWLSPVNPAPSYHRYDATDLFNVDPILGNVEAMKSLTAAAHDRGMRVILDFVPSHLSRDHESFVRARARRDAQTRDWFYFYEWPDSYRSFLEVVPSLVSVNTESEGVREFMIASARFWMECGIDGFRLDHVIGHGMDFWVQFQEALEAVNHDVVTFGEATDTGDALRRYQGRMNGILDFPLARALRLTFATGDWSVLDLDGFLELYDSYMADAPVRVSFLDNHDMDRFLHVAGQDRDAILLALVCLMTLPQIPVIYYGTEIGMTHEVSTSDRERGGDALARQDMEWDPAAWDTDLRNRTASLTRLRLERAATVRGRRRRLHLDASAGLYAYALEPAPATGAVREVAPGAGDRGLQPSAAAGAPRESLVVAFNVSSESARIAIRGARATVFATRDDVALSGTDLILPPRSASIVTVAPAP